MEKMNEVAVWEEVVVLQDGEVLNGGIEGKANMQAQVLANRTCYLKEKIAVLETAKVFNENNELIFPDGSRLGILK